MKDKQAEIDKFVSGFLKIVNNTNGVLNMSAVGRRLGMSPAAVRVIAERQGVLDRFSHGKRSKGEEELAQFMESLGYKVERNRRDLISPYEIDIWLPELNLGIEYNGKAFHGNASDSKKLVVACSKGILMWIITDEQWKRQNEEVRAWIVSELVVVRGEHYIK